MYGTFLAKESPLLFKQNSQKILEWINLIVVSDLNGKIYAGPPSVYRPIRARLAQSGPGLPNQGPARPIRVRLAGQWEAGLKNISLIWISGRRRGGFVWVNPSSKCTSCHSNETDQRYIHMHVNVSLKAYVYDKTIYNSCARAHFAGCTYLRHIILGLNTVWDGENCEFSEKGL
jgi:hypothetical protein